MEAHVASYILDCMAVVQFRTPFAVVTINIAVLEDTRVMWRKVKLSVPRNNKMLICFCE